MEIWDGYDRDGTLANVDLIRDEMACVKRELLEETGIRSGSFTVIGKIISKDTIFISFLCITDCDKSSIRLQNGETITFTILQKRDT